MMHLTHFIYVYMPSDKNHSDNESRNLLLPLYMLFLPIIGKESYMHHPTNRKVHATSFVKPVVEHWLEQEMTQYGVPNETDSTPILKSLRLNWQLITDIQQYGTEPHIMW